MPKRTDIHTILILGSGPIVIGQGCEFDYSGVQACKALRREGYRVVLVNSNPATIMTDPEMADATYVEPLTVSLCEKIISAERPDALLPTVGGQTGLNLAMDLAHAGVLEQYGVQLIGVQTAAIELAEDRLKFEDRDDCSRTGGAGLRPGALRRRGRDSRLAARFPLPDPALLHPGRIGRRHRLLNRGSATHRRPGHRRVAGGRGTGRAVCPGLEGIRAGGHARPGRQFRRGLFHRKHRPDGRPHRRQHHRSPRADPHRSRVPAPAGHGAHGDPDRGRRNRRLQRAVCRQSSHRRGRGHRDEPARQPVLGAGIEGDRLPYRQDRRAARRGLHPGRNPQRHHARHTCLVRAIDRLLRRQDPALEFREVPRRRSHAWPADEIGGRGDGNRAHLPGSAQQGDSRARDRPRPASGHSSKSRPMPPRRR